MWDDNTGTGTFTYYHRIAGRTVAFTTGGVTTWMHADQVSSTSVTQDENGVVRTQRYTPFGEVRTDGNLAADHTYTGQIEDTTTGLAFYNARYYDPIVGRFISPDTLTPDLSDGQSYNRYTYVLNNPVRHTDSSGHCADYLPCSPNAPTTTDEADLALATMTEGPAERPDNFFDVWAQNNPELAWRIVQTSAGTLQAISGGTADDLLDFEEKGVDPESGIFRAAETYGNVLMLPLSFTPAGSLYMMGAGGANTALDCHQAASGGSGVDCGTSAFGTTVDVVGAAGTRGFGGKLSGLDVLPGNEAQQFVQGLTAFVGGAFSTVDAAAGHNWGQTSSAYNYSYITPQSSADSTYSPYSYSQMG